jgi:AraC-like DNA-binding protein
MRLSRLRQHHAPVDKLFGFSAITNVGACPVDCAKHVTLVENMPFRRDELSAIAGLSPFHLVRSFTRRFGLPPHAYQIHVRVERARALLTTGMPPVQVASSVGFADQSHFTRHFRRINNVTPANYARAFR